MEEEIIHQLQQKKDTKIYFSLHALFHLSVDETFLTDPPQF